MKDAFVNQSEREAAQRCKDQLRAARTALREAAAAAQQAGFGGNLIADIEDSVLIVNRIRSEYDLV